MENMLNDASVTGHDEMTPLRAAACSSNVGVVRLLLEAGKKVTPLRAAIRSSNTEFAKAMQEYYATK
jgi:hypothetical protein